MSLIIVTAFCWRDLRTGDCVHIAPSRCSVHSNERSYMSLKIGKYSIRILDLEPKTKRKRKVHIQLISDPERTLSLKTHIFYRLYGKHLPPTLTWSSRMILSVNFLEWKRRHLLQSVLFFTVFFLPPVYVARDGSLTRYIKCWQHYVIVLSCFPKNSFRFLQYDS